MFILSSTVLTLFLLLILFSLLSLCWCVLTSTVVLPTVLPPELIIFSSLSPHLSTEVFIYPWCELFRLFFNCTSRHTVSLLICFSRSLCYYQFFLISIVLLPVFFFHLSMYKATLTSLFLFPFPNISQFIFQIFIKKSPSISYLSIVLSILPLYSPFSSLSPL